MTAAPWTSVPFSAAPQEIDLGSHVGWMITLPVLPRKTGSAMVCGNLSRSHFSTPVAEVLLWYELFIKVK